MGSKPKLDPSLALGLGLGLVLLVSSRLPTLLDGSGLDGDESILALMAWHLARAAAWSPFFYGQSFGLAIFEAAPVALVFRLFGAATPHVRWTLLALWGVGALVFFLAVRRWAGTPSAYLATLLLILCPAWFRWSTMARGYHVSAFALSQLGLWQVARLDAADRSLRPPIAWLLLGASIGLLLLTNGIWLLAFSPLVLLVLSARARRRNVALVAVGFAVTLAVVLLPALGTLSTAWSPSFLRSPDIGRALSLLPKRVAVTFEGAHAYGVPTESGPVTHASGMAWSLGLALALLRGFALFLRREPLGLRHACLAGILLVLGLSLVVNERAFAFRYFQPIVHLVILFWAVDLPALRWRAGSSSKLALGGLVVFVVLLGAASALEAPGRRRTPALEPTALSEDASIAALVQDLEAAGVRYVYCLHPTFQWNIIFYSGERVIARSFDPRDRRPEYPAAVNRALFARERVAVVGRPEQWETVKPVLASHGYPPAPVHVSGGRYFWIVDPEVELVRRLGFRFEGTVRDWSGRLDLNQRPLPPQAAQ